MSWPPKPTSTRYDPPDPGNVTASTVCTCGGTGAPGGRVPDDPTATSPHPKPDLGEHMAHQPVLLVAIAAPAPVDQLVGERLRTQVVDRHPQHRIEVFERNGLRVRGHQVSQDVKGGLGGAVIVDAVEVSVQISVIGPFWVACGDDEFCGPATRRIRKLSVERC